MAKASKQDRDLLATILKRHEKAVQADRENRLRAVEDMEFLHVPGKQWEDWLRKERGADGTQIGRPCYEFNKLRISVKRLINDLRQNRPAGKVLGSEDGDKATAEIYEGLIRNIWNLSDGDTVVDGAAEWQIGGGMGAWRLNTRYSSDSTFDQDIVIEGFDNPLCVYCDPSARDPMKRDAQYWFVTTKMSRATFEATYPNAEADSFGSDVEFDSDEDWEDGESVRVVEYWYKEPYERTLLLFDDGRVIDAEEVAAEGMPAGASIQKSRTMMANRIKMVIASGSAILKRADWAGSQFPFVQVFGESMVIDGKRYWFGATRHSKDAQRAYNYSRTSVIESVALTPQAKFWATPEQAEGHVANWKEAHSKLYPFLLYNADAKTGGAPPQRMGGADVPVAMIQEVQMSGEDIKGTIGIFDASLGNRSNETSGIAIRSRQQQSELANFNYGDNLGKAIRRTWELLIDLIPKIYDAPRIIRTLGQDGAEKYVAINQPDPVTGQVLNDLGHGRFDVAVKIGPSFTTQREQAAEIYMGIAQADKTGMTMTVAGDLIYKSMDLPYSDEIAERMRAMLPPQIQSLLQDGKEIPPEAMAAMAQANAAMQQVQMMAAQMERDAQEIEKGQKEVEAGKAELQRMIGDLKVQQANLKATEAQLQAKIAQADADLSKREMAVEMKGQMTDVRGQALESTAAQNGQQAAAEIVKEALAQVSEQIRSFESNLKQMQAQQPIIVPVGGGRRTVSVKRGKGGELVGTVEDAE